MYPQLEIPFLFRTGMSSCTTQLILLMSVYTNSQGIGVLLKFAVNIEAKVDFTGQVWYQERCLSQLIINENSRVNEF